MKTSPMAILTLAVVAGLASDASAQKSRTTCGPDVYLNVQIIGTPTAPSNNVLVSDGNEYYNHGSPRSLVARFQVDNCTHDFTLLMGQSRRYMMALLPGGDEVSEFFNFDRVHSVPVTSSGLFTDVDRAAWLSSPYCVNGVQRTADGKIVKNADGSEQDNYAGCGIDDAGNGYVLRGGGMSLTNETRLGFHPSPIDVQAGCTIDTTNPTCAASYVRVYHPFDTQWIVKADATALASYQAWVNGNGGGWVHQRFENLPLEIIANKQ